MSSLLQNKLENFKLYISFSTKMYCYISCCDKLKIFKNSHGQIIVIQSRILQQKMPE